MKRCVSKCSGIKEEACQEPCSFVNKRYCRMSSQYKMGPYPGCEVVKKESILKTVKPTKPATATKPIKTIAKTVKALPKPATKPVKTVTKDVKAVTKSITKPVTNTVKATKSAKPVTKTRAKTVKTTKTVPNSRSTLNNLSITNLVLEKMRKDKGVKEKVQELKKIMDGYPSNTLFYSLDESIQKRVIGLIKMIDEDSPEPPYNTESISKTKNTLNKIIAKLKNTSAKTIQTFMKKTEGKRKALFYGAICSDSGVCLALGKERQNLLNFFQFKTFEYAKAPYKTIGALSGNGFVKELKYQREGYVGYALLKSSLKAGSDNLAYEYLVGKYLNEVSKKLPNFVETYGLFHYPSTKERAEMKEQGRFTRPLVPFEPTDMKNVCRKAQNMCVLTQYLKETKSFAEHYEDPYFREHLSPHVFYQIYFTLHQLRKEFTHYDLHRNNILLYEPGDGKYIEYHYHGDKTVRFKSKYIVKIIDYGRCFFKNSMDYYKKICAEPTCEPMCGIKKGFSTFHMDLTMGRFVGFVNSAVKNESQDLRPLYDTYLHSKEITDKSLDPDYLKILSDTVYLKGMFTTRIKDKSFGRGYGTIEDLGKSDKIHNVSDAYKRWETYITHPDRVQANENDFVNHKCLGELHIYTDGRDLEYIPKG